jgi:putative aldouronate transport system substrate-binding protein
MYENTYVALGPVYSEKDIEGVEMPTANWKIEEHYLNGSLPNVRRGFGISVKSQYAEKIVAMWEEMMSDEWQMIFNWGIKDEDYYVDENGRLNMTEEQYAHTQDANWKLANKAEAFFQSSPKKQGWIMDGEFKGNCWEPGNQDEIVFGLMNEYDKEFLSKYNYSKWADFVNPPIELAPFGEAWQIDYTPVDVDHTDFCAIQDKRLPEIIMCDPAELDAKWDAFVEEIKPSAKVFEDYMQEHVVIEAHKVLDNK